MYVIKCDKDTTTRSSLFKNKNGVHEKISFVYFLCDKSFSRKDAMKCHKKATHEKFWNFNAKYVLPNLLERQI